MTDKILKETYDKMVAIEEGGNPYSFDDHGVCKVCNGEGIIAGDECDACGGFGDADGAAAEYGNADLEEGGEEDVKLHDAAIDLLDDMLDMLEGNDRHGEKGNLLRYAIKRLQEVGLGR